MSVTSAGHLEDLIIGLGADDMGSAAVVQRFEQGIIRGTTQAQGHADEYGRAMARAQELTMAVAGPMERFERQVDELDDLMRLGAISQEVYNKNFDRLQKELTQTVPKVNHLTAALTKLESLSGLGYKLSFALTTPLTILGGIALKTASDAEETLNKFGVIFGPVMEQANAAIVDLDKNFGLTAGSARKMMSGTGDLLKGFGFSANSALDLSTQVQKLSVDIASFSNVEGGATRVSEAMTKAMLGEREMLKEMGISILEEDVKLKVAQLTKEGHIFATERQAKAYATLAIAMDQSAHRLGDFAATEGSFANQTRMLTDEFWELVELFGKELIPIALQLTKDVLRPMIEYFKDLSPETKKWVVILGGIAAAAGPVLITVAALAGSLNTLIGLGPGLMSMGTSFMALRSAGIAGTGVQTLAQSITGLRAAGGVASLVTNLGTRMAGLATGANLARLGIYALGTYLAYEGLKYVLGYHKAIADLEAAQKRLGATEALLQAGNDKRFDKSMEDAMGIKKLDERKAALEDLKKVEQAHAADYAKMMVADQKVIDREGAGPGTADYQQSLQMATDNWNKAKARVNQIDGELEATKEKADKIVKDNTSDLLAGHMANASNAVSGLFSDIEHLATGGPTAEEKDMVNGAVNAVGNFIGQAVENRIKDKDTASWWNSMFDGPAEKLGLISENVIDLKAVMGQTWEIEFKAKGLDKLSADGIDALAMWQEQAYKTAEQIQIAQNAPQDAAAGFNVAGGAMVGGGLFGLVGGLTAQAAANTELPPGQAERDERDRRKAAALAKLAEKEPIVFEVAGPL